MKKKPAMEVISGRAQMVGSLFRSINEAGGSSVHIFKEKNIMKLTVQELINMLGQNGIRFYFAKPKRTKKNAKI